MVKVDGVDALARERRSTPLRPLFHPCEPGALDEPSTAVAQRQEHRVIGVAQPQPGQHRRCCCGHDVDHAGLAAELPGRHLLVGDQPHRSGLGKSRSGGWDEVGRGVEVRAGVFTPTGSMNARRIGHTMTLLDDGRVLVEGPPRAIQGDPQVLAVYYGR